VEEMALQIVDEPHGVVCVMIRLLFELILGHFFADIALQDIWMAETKRAFGEGYDWVMLHIAHGMMHAMVVYLITNSMVLALVELVTHVGFDYAKCRDMMGIFEDQICHLVMKIIYASIITFGGALI